MNTQKKKPTASKKRNVRKTTKKPRGFKFGLHDVMAQADPGYAKKREDWVRFVYLDDRHVDARTKELVIIGILAALKSPPTHIKLHIDQAVKAGATKEEIIVVIQFAGHWGGTVTQHNALEAWRLQFANEMPEVYQALKP